MILYDETLRQSTSDGTPIPDFLTERGMIPGIKVDKGAKALAGFPREKVTEGLDVATAIQGVETAGADQPIDDVIINSITIIEN